MARLQRNTLSMLVLLFYSCFVCAGNGMSDEQMQQMMKNAQKMQECMAGIDPAVFSKIETRGRQVQAKVKALCDTGKRNKAQEMSAAYGRELNASQEMKEIRKCGALAESMINDMPMVKEKQDEIKGRHVCDQ